MFESSVCSPIVASEAVVVARTRMGEGKVCIGAYDIENEKNIRLLAADGSQQLEACDLFVGYRVKVSYKHKGRIDPPHTEDVNLLSFSLVKKIPIDKLCRSITKVCPVVDGSIINAFSGTLSYEESASLSVRRNRIPDHSVCFWVADRTLKRTNYDGRAKYCYQIENKMLWIPFVGTQLPVREIPEGSLVRLSLARWWKHQSVAYEKRCQLQISGWYF